MRYCLMLLCIVVLVSCQAVDSIAESISEETYQMLNNIRDKKKKQLFDYLERMRNNADVIKSDKAMIEFFHIKRKFYQLQKKTPPPEELKRDIETLKLSIREQYLRHYLAFYDILFVDKNGDVFYTIRQQQDYHENIFVGKLAETDLAKQLKKNPFQKFVDYQYYAASGEPSAFLIVPVMKAQNLAGWFIFQCAINKINSIFTNDEALGATGEVLLVNKKNFLLTDSRFYSESSILNKSLAKNNIAEKFREKTGQKIVTDYRGFRVLSSFDICNVANSEWLLISKIDEDEIITNQYRKNSKGLYAGMIGLFKGVATSGCDPALADREQIVVDMDEFRKVKNKEILRTFGVSTCTAVIVSIPDKFAYMAHISNLDIIYGGHTTDLTGNILKRIKNFDIYRHEIRNLRITIIANHLDTTMSIIDKLVEEGVFLSQIKVMYADKTKYANILHDYVKNQTLVVWKMDNEPGNNLQQCASDVRTVGNLIKPLIGY